MLYPYLGLISILICLVSANELNDPHDDYSQAINSYDQLGTQQLGNSTTQNVADLLQTLALANSTVSQSSQNLTGLATNLTTANIPTLFNTYQYDSPVYQEARAKDQSTSSSSSSQSSTLLDSSGTNQNFYTKEYAGFDDNQKMYIEQQIEQDSKYLPEIFDLPPPVPAQVIEQSASSAPTDSAVASQVNVFDYGTKINKITRPSQSGTIRTAPVLASRNRLNKYPVKGTVNSIKMANNQEWNVIEKTQGGYINVARPSYNDNASLKSTVSSYQPSDDSFSSLDQQYDLTKLSKSQSAGQASGYSRPIEGTTQIITASNPQQVPSSSYQLYNAPQLQQQIISSSYSSPVKQSQTVAQYNQQASAYVRKPPCTKHQNSYSNYDRQTDRQRPFYFGWKQQQQRLNNAQKAAVNQATSYVQQQAISYPISSPANQNRYFGMPNQFDQQPFNKGRKCCIVRLVPKPGFNKGQQQPQFGASSMPYFNPFQNNLTGMFGVGVSSVVNKIENKKRKVKKLIKAPFMFVNGMKQKAFSSANQFRAPAYPSRPSYSPSNYSPSSYGSNYVQQQNTFGTKSASSEYSY